MHCVNIPDIRDLLLQSLSVLLQYEGFVRVFERDEIDKHIFVKSLLGSFESRFWVSISNILLRFWKVAVELFLLNLMCKKGTGFAQEARKQNDCSSKIYQGAFREVCTTDPELLSEFLNKVFNHLNWAISEFEIAAKEVYFSTALLIACSFKLQ